MSSVWMRFRAEARSRWRAWLALALLVGIASGGSIAAAAGARRTQSAYPRLVASHESYDVTFGGTGEGRDIDAESAAIIALPEVADATRVRFVSANAKLPDGRTVGFPDFIALVDPSGKDGVTLSRWKILAGRLPDPGRADEGIIPFNTTDKLGLHVGDVVTVFIGDPFADPAHSPAVPVRIVGVGVQPGSMPVVGTVSFAGLSLTPAFDKKYAAEIPEMTDGPSVRLKRRSDLLPFLAAVAKIDPVIDIPSKLPEHLTGVRRTLRFEVLALWALSALLALAGIAIVGQAIARQVYLGAQENETLRSLGMGRKHLTFVSLTIAAGIAIVGTLVAGVIAYLGSWMTPIGLARVAEPAPGFVFDSMIYGLGAAATIAGVLLATALPAWRVAGRAWSARVASSTRTGAAVVRALPVPAATGVRMALSPGRRGDTVPVRSAVLGTMIGVGALVAALVFGTSLHHLIVTPRLSGYLWDTTMVLDGPGADLYRHLDADRDVAAWTRGGISNVELPRSSKLGKQIQALCYEAARPIRPGIVEGRAPRTVDEIALGLSTMRVEHAHVGGTIEVTFPANAEDPKSVARHVRMRVVGSVVIPPFFFGFSGPGEGVAFTVESLFKYGGVGEDERNGVPALVRLKPGIELDGWLEATKKAVPGLFVINKREPGAELLSLGRVSGLPMALAGILAVLAAGALIHALVTSIRRRRREFAVLKTLGFVGSQVRSAIRWQSMTMTAVAVIVAVPAGIVTGRWLWLLFARDIGVIPEALIPGLAFAVAPFALILAAVIGVLPARAAARTQAAVVLRTE
jgi:putative ABC transport system permease protein